MRSHQAYIGVELVQTTSFYRDLAGALGLITSRYSSTTPTDGTATERERGSISEELGYELSYLRTLILVKRGLR